MYKISRNKYLDFEYLFLVKKQMRATEVIIEDGSVGARVGNGDLFITKWLWNISHPTKIQPFFSVH